MQFSVFLHNLDIQSHKNETLQSIIMNYQLNINELSLLDYLQLAVDPQMKMRVLHLLLLTAFMAAVTLPLAQGQGKGSHKKK